MKKTYLSTMSIETQNMLLRQGTEVLSSSLKEQQKQIKDDSSYSEDINKAISSYSEFLLYHSLKLKEAIVTRRALIKDLDMNLWVSCENKTNRQLLEEGKSPYAYDSEDGKIEIHHIGQDYNGPFAELTVEEHKFYGNSRILHDSKEISWRNDYNKKKEFNGEKIKYWRARVAKEYKIVPMKPFKSLEKRSFASPEKVANNIKSVLEIIFSESSIDDLNYISSLADSYAMIKQIGAKNINEFINNKLKENELTCTFCGEQNYTLNGSYKTSEKKIQKYKCKKCGRVFTQVNNSIMSGSNLSFIEWLRFIDCLYNGFSVNKTAQICNMSTRSVQTNRYKLFYALKLLDDRTQLKGNVVVDETYFSVSYKGNQNSDKITIPRKSHRRGGENHKKGLSDEKVCVVCGLDDEGNCIARIAGRATPSYERLHFAYGSALDSEELINLYADKARATAKYARRNGLPLIAEKQIRKGTHKITDQEINKRVILVNRYLQKMNSFHNRLHRFVNQFIGVSSSYLAGYLYLFTWKERNKHKDKYEAYKELLDVMTQRNLHITNEELCTGMFLPNPFKFDAKKKTVFINQKRADQIYALHAQGMLNTEIAKLYEMTPQGIGRIIRKYDASGLGYQTEKEKLRDQEILGYTAKELTPTHSQEYIELYQAKMHWKGGIEDFYQEMMKKYGLSKQTIRNRISKGKRIIALKDSIFVNNKFDFNDLKTLYQDVYTEYVDLQARIPTKLKRCEIIAQKYHYTVQNILRIVSIMESDTKQYFARKNIRLSPTETTNRDKAIFVDYLNWKGSKPNFLIWAQEKYHISQNNIQSILYYCLEADPRRKDMV